MNYDDEEQEKIIQQCPFCGIIVTGIIDDKGWHPDPHFCHQKEGASNESKAFADDMNFWKGLQKDKGG